MAEDLPGRRILAADDNPDALDLLDQILSRLGCIVIPARDGAEALALYEKSRPDLVILDVNMPKMSGIEVCKEIKTRAVDEWVPVMLLTALDWLSARVEGLAAGADDYVAKPFDTAELTARVRALLRTKSIYDRASANHKETPKRVLARRKELTVLFSDIRGFTSIADQLSPEEVAEVLERYFAEMGDVVFDFGGTINKVIGDGLMVLFNDPEDQPDHPARALRTGLAMRERALELQASLHSVLPEPFAIGIGIHTGPVTIGHIGAGRLLDYTAVGATVNLASRLQAFALNNEVIASRSTYASLGARVQVRNERREAIRGFAHPVAIGEVISLDGVSDPASTSLPSSPEPDPTSGVRRPTPTRW